MAAVPGLTYLCSLGRGSTATVSLAYDPVSGRLVAVKSAEMSVASPLQHEYRVLSSVRSPHVVSCYGSYTTGSHFHILLEFCPSGSLFDCVRSDCEGHLDERSIGLYVRDILLGLCDLHSNDICHGDIKSQNVLIGSDGRAKIADFGASVRIGKTHNEKLAALSGTPAFMAPEVARGEEQGTAADIWALGCTIVEMATGKAPWTGILKESDIIAAIYQIGYCPDSMPEIPSLLSKTGQDFVANCLIRDPSKRWSAEQLLRHPFVCSNDAGLTRNGTFDHAISPQSALDFHFGDAFYESDAEESVSELESESESGSDPFARIRELAGSPSSADHFTSDSDAGDCWIEVRSGSTEEGDRDHTTENGDQFEFCEEDIDSDLFNLFNFGHVFERTVHVHDMNSVGVENVCSEFHVCKCNANLTNNKTMNTCFDQIMNLPPLFFFGLPFLNYFCANSV